MIHLFYYYLIAISILGYGVFLNKKLLFKSKNLGIIGFLGIFFLIIISYLSSIIISHNYIFNQLILIIGLSLFFIFFIKKEINKSKLKIFFFTFLILFIFILVGKNHDDFAYYHFPYIKILTELSHPFGLGQLNNGFRNQSSLFFF